MAKPKKRKPTEAEKERARQAEAEHEREVIVRAVNIVILAIALVVALNKEIERGWVWICLIPFVMVKFWDIITRVYGMSNPAVTPRLHRQAMTVLAVIEIFFVILMIVGLVNLVF